MLGLTWNYRARWRFIGIELGVDEGTLGAIDKDNRKVDDCLREMITTWLSRCNPKPSRHALTRALQSARVSTTVGMSHLYLLLTFLHVACSCILITSFVQ